MMSCVPSFNCAQLCGAPWHDTQEKKNNHIHISNNSAVCMKFISIIYWIRWCWRRNIPFFFVYFRTRFMWKERKNDGLDSNNARNCEVSIPFYKLLEKVKGGKNGRSMNFASNLIHEDQGYIRIKCAEISHKYAMRFFLLIKHFIFSFFATVWDIVLSYFYHYDNNYARKKNEYQTAATVYRLSHWIFTSSS